MPASHRAHRQWTPAKLISWGERIGAATAGVARAPPSSRSRFIDGGAPVCGLLADTLISRFADHLPYYRQKTINSRPGTNTLLSTRAA
jgi:transposase